MDFNLQELQQLRELNLKLDKLVEQVEIARLDLESSMGKVFMFLADYLKISAMFIETQDENLNQRVFSYGDCDDNIKRQVPQLHQVLRAISFNFNNVLWYAQPIEMAGSITGSVAIAFAHEHAPSKNLGTAMLDCISELLDNFFFSIHSSSLKHSLIMGVQSALKNHSIVDSIDGAVYVLKKEIPFKKLFIIYSDHELTGVENTNYLVYEGDQRTFDSTNTPHPGLESFIKNDTKGMTFDTEAMKKAIGCEHLTITYLLDGLIDENLIGKVIFVPEEGRSFSIFAREIVQVFAETLRQRLVDFNRERNMLRKFFPDPVISRLTAEPGYEKLYLTPRAEEIGIIFADISGFTKMSEQILKTPERITAFVDQWSNGIVTKVFPLGACLDKIVGDCLIFLFGPPFYELEPVNIVEKVLESAKIIVDYTNEFLRLPENADIQKHPDFEKFGVAVGTNFCPAVVGLIGPNDDLTAFSSGMNITARLQGLAKAGQILATERLKELAMASGHWEFAGPESAPVKNVEKPLVYYHVKPARK
ncbi:MAG TPA: adenylate/guanylate cyclase domain-containing protein [Candidatus Rifleibacterium sp.]|nr:adenylate/guanylate cyclase domain-containing protein [Candidatus Rifleibacterium sp.]HPT45123.1 adenylate/guanylate cyclase domain-containing protein [Candidatus Rifleibacterium sp.]